MITISGYGIELIRDLLNRGSFKVNLKGRMKESNKLFKVMQPFTTSNGTWWRLEQWMKYEKFDWDRYMKRIVATSPVDDFDIDRQHMRIWKRFKKGVYDVKPIEQF